MTTQATEINHSGDVDNSDGGSGDDSDDIDCKGSSNGGNDGIKGELCTHFFMTTWQKKGRQSDNMKVKIKLMGENEIKRLRFLMDLNRLDMILKFNVLRGF